VANLNKLVLEIDELEKLQVLFKAKSSLFCFLGYTVDLKNKTVYDELKHENLGKSSTRILNILLSHYAKANPVELTQNLIKFSDLPGGCAYEAAFNQRVIQPMAKLFGENKETFVKASGLLNGKTLSHGDVSVTIPAMPTIPLTYVLWLSDEFPASATVLYDSSASRYLPTEDLAVLAELTTIRLEIASSTIKNLK
jgi:hypothetical protein